MSISVSRRLNILCIKLKIREFFITKLITHLYARVRMWKTLTWTHHTAKRGGLRHKITLARLKQAIHESERSCICMSVVMYMYVRGIDFVSVSTIF